MPPVDPSLKEMVMIKDENGVEQPWSIILRPEKIEKNYNLRKLMELGSDSNDIDEDDETAKAKEAIYRSICLGIRSAMNALIPHIHHGKLKWKDVDSGQRNAVRLEVLEANPYLNRFKGGWIEELIMQRQLRNSRDTVARKKRKGKAHELKPLDHLAKQSRSKTKKRAMNSGGSHGLIQTGANTPPQGPTPTASHQRTSSTQVDPCQQGEAPAPSNDLDMGGEDPVSGSSTDKRPSGANSRNQATMADDNDSESGDEDWSRGVDKEITTLNQGNASHASSSTTKGGKKAPKSLGTATPRAKPRPKQRPPPNAGADEGTATELFRRTTRGRKEQTIDEVEAVPGSTSKGKSTAKKSKASGNKKKGGK